MLGPSFWWGCCPCSICCVLGVPLGKGTGRSHCVAIIPYLVLLSSVCCCL